MARVESGVGDAHAAREALVAHAYHESMVARFAVRALHETTADAVVSEAISIVTATIDSARVHVLEFASDGTPRLRGGVGPTRGLADRAARALAFEAEEHDLKATLPGTARDRVASAFILRGRSGPLGILDVQTHGGNLSLEEGRFLGSIAEVLGAAIDRERDLGALRASEERFRLLVDGTRDHALILLDADGRISTWNSGAQRIRGYSGEEIVGRHFSCFYCPEERDRRPAADLAIAAAQGRFENEGWQVRADGRRFYASVSVSPLRDDRRRLMGFAHVTRDVSARARADQERRLLAEAGAALAESLDYEITLNRVAQLAVPGFADWCVVDLVGNDGFERVAVAHADPKKVVWARAVAGKSGLDGTGDSVAEVLQSGRPILVAAISDEMMRDSAKNADHLGTLRELGLTSYVCVPLLARGHTLGAITFVSAESKRRYDDQDLSFAEELARRCALAVDNARLYRQAQEAIRDRDQFFSIASHELRTPLAALKLYLQSLLRVVEIHPDQPGLLARVVEKAGTAVRQVERMSKLVDTLLDATQLQRGPLRLEVESFDACDMLREVVERFREAAAEAGCSFGLEAPGAVTVRWDRIRMEEVLNNLLSNAIKYSPGRPIDVTLSPVDSSVRLRVTDHGSGIAVPDLTRIFRPFGRVAAEKAAPGLGLGLYITRRIVEAHGGRIDASSKPDSGTTFTVEVPLNAASETQPAPLGTPASAGGPRG